MLVGEGAEIVTAYGGFLAKKANFQECGCGLTLFEVLGGGDRV